MLRPHSFLIAFSCGLSTSLIGACNDDKGTYDADGDGYVSDDCDDNDPYVNPGENEICDDGLDNDCSGGDAQCYVDADGDGWLVEDDCDDNDALVNPGMSEDCGGIDDNCDGIVSECVFPSLIYEPTTAGPVDSYDAAVYADLAVFGDPGNGGFAPIGDGRALFFTPDAGLVDESAAVLVSDGAVGEDGAYGISVAPLGDHLCITADYQDDGAAADAGKSWCFDESTVRGASATLALTDAAFTTTGELAGIYSKAEAELDVDGDGNLDLVVYTANDVQVIYGTGAPWSGDYRIPSDADLSLGDCASSTSGWCSFGRSFGGSSVIALSEEGGTPDSISLYSLPLSGGAPTATVSLDRNYGDSATHVELISGVAFGNSLDGEVTFLDSAGDVQATATGTNDFGYWTSSFIDARGHELLLVSAAYDFSDHSSGMGVVYVFDLTQNGLPSSHEEAQYVLIPPDTHSQCGNRARGGLVADGNGTHTVVAVACPGTGGAAYQLNYQLDPPPPVYAADIWSPEQGHYKIRQWVVDAYTSELEWIHSLAQTEPVVAQGNIVGWRLHAISSGSPLHRAGLRTGDVVRRVNGIDVTSPNVVNQLYSAFNSAQALTLGIMRNGTPRQLNYAIVP